MDRPSANSAIRGELDKLQLRVHALQLQLERLEGVDRDHLEVVTCLAGDQTVAVPLEFVERVVLVPALLPLPDAPAWLPGCLVLAGEPIAVTDVTARLSGKRREISISDVVVIARVDDKRVGLLVQDASGVWNVARSEINKLADGASHARFVLGLIPVQDRVGMLLSVRAVTTVDEIR
ncbi:MAG: chemotaxis protein CheW [Deltaproteobacteria bacterium]|nr:chemotaxis protein CheW [Deltaproteobacteria bacterium]